MGDDGVERDKRMSQNVEEEEEEEEAFLRKLVLPQEDCRRLGVSWTGGYRWFRSPNVVCLEHYCRRKSLSANDAAQHRAQAPVE